MAVRQHTYRIRVKWTGNSGTGTRSHRSYERAHEIVAAGKPAIPGSSDPSFLGDMSRWNPEELMVASLAACHKLWYLALCAQAGVVVTAYEDAADGCMTEEANGAGQFSAVTLRPRVTISAASDKARAFALHREAHKMCFIARSVNFPVTCSPAILQAHDRSASHHEER